MAFGGLLNWGTFDPLTGAWMLGLGRSFDTNDRYTDAYALLIPGASQIPQGGSFQIGDGVNIQTFRFLDPSKPLPSDISGIPIFFSGRLTGAQMAALVVASINSINTIKVTASSITAGTLNSGGSNLVELFGAKFVQFDSLWKTSGTYADAYGDNFTGPANIVNIPIARGDNQHNRPQGWVILDANQIEHSSQYGIVVDAAARDTAGNWAHPGSVLPLTVVNTQRLVPGITVQNNVIAFNGTGGDPL